MVVCKCSIKSEVHPEKGDMGMEFADVKVGDKIINSEHSVGIYIVSDKSHDLISVTDINNYKDCFYFTKRSIRKYELFENFKGKVIIKEGISIKLNNEIVTITEVVNNVGFYYRNSADELKFCNALFETLNFEPVFE